MKYVPRISFIRWSEYLGNPECPFMRRWVLDLKLFSIRLHQWLRSDDDRHFHCHPWNFVTWVIKGSYTDVNPEGRELMRAGSVTYRPAVHKHTVWIDRPGCWTFVVTGPKIRRWGFWKNGKFVKSNKYFLEHGHPACND